MFCKNCGNQIDDKAAVCIHCGVAVQKEEASPKSNTNAIVGFIFSFLIAIVGLICSIIGLKKAPECGGKGKGLAIAGIVISIVNMIGGILLLS